MQQVRSQTGSSAVIIIVACTVVVMIGLSGAMALIRSNNADKDRASTDTKTTGEITNFKECAAAGNPVQESYPERCTTEDGKSFVNTP